MYRSVSRVRITVALALLAVALFLFFRTRQEAKEAEEKARAAVLNVLNSQVAAWNEGDLEGFMNGYWKSDDLTFFSEDKAEVGWQETYNRYRNRYQGEGKEMGHLEFDRLHIDTTGPTSAVVRGHWQLTFKDGRTRGGLFTLLCRREAQGWCVVHDHTSAGPPVELLPPPQVSD